MKIQKRTALLLSLLMSAACWNSCGSKPEEAAAVSQPEPEQTAVDAAEPQTEPEETEPALTCSVPEDLTLGGETVKEP